MQSRSQSRYKCSCTAVWADRAFTRDAHSTAQQPNGSGGVPVQCCTRQWSLCTHQRILCPPSLLGPCWPAVPSSGCGSAAAGKHGVGTAVHTGRPTAADGSHTSQGTRATCESTGTKGQAHGWTPRQLELTSSLVCDLRRVCRPATLMWWCWVAHWASCWQPHCWHTAAGTVGKARRSRCVWLLWSGASWLDGSRNGTAPKPTCR